MSISKRLKLVIVYQCLGMEIPIAAVWDADLLEIAKEKALQNARMKLQLVKDTDPVLRVNAETELRRIQKTLDRLIPAGHEP